MEALCRGALGRDAKRGTMGQGWPTVTTLGTVPKRGKFRAAKPGCRVRFLFGYFLFRASKEKVTRRKAETGSSLHATVNGYMAFFCACPVIRSSDVGWVESQRDEAQRSILGLLGFAALNANLPGVG